MIVLIKPTFFFAFYKSSFYKSSPVQSSPVQSAKYSMPYKMKNLPTLHNDSSFAVQFSISVSKTRAIFLFKIKIKLIEMFELHKRMQYQATIPLKFFIIIYNYANV